MLYEKFAVFILEVGSENALSYVLYYLVPAPETAGVKLLRVGADVAVV